MKKRLLAAIPAVLLVVLLLVGTVVAMTSTNYGLNWFVNLTGAGGGRSSSTNYIANFTISQNAVGVSTSTNYSAGLGFWAESPFVYSIYVPAVKK